MIEITQADFSIEEAVGRARRSDAGATVAFIGTVRDDGDGLQKMELEAFPEAAIHMLEEIRDDASARFRLKSVEIVHRTGSLNVGDNIVLIVCTAGHRKQAFEGCSYILEELKAKAPIWKKEIRVAGEEWVRP